MDGREGMTLQGSASYYLNRGGFGGPGPSLNVHGGGGVGGGGGSSTLHPGGGLHTPPPGYKTLPNSNQNISVHPNIGMSGGSMSGSNFQESPNYPPHGMSMSMVSSSLSPGGSETVKKKRGRPRKYGPDGANMSLGLSPMSRSKANVSGERARRGRPPGSGWKQKLAPLGEWMNSSAGLAFTPHVLHIGIGEDVAEKILAFAQQRPRALCILSATGSVSVVTLRQPTTSGGTVTYEGRFEILCLSGSYLVNESGGPRNRSGGISISVCSSDGHMIGGAIGGKLVAANPVQVVACSFVYGGSTTTKAQNKLEPETVDGKYLLEHSGEKSTAPISIAGPSQNPTPNSGTSVWPPNSHQDIKISHGDIDLTRG